MGIEHIRWLAECADAGAEKVGGKAVGLGVLSQLGLPVPPGFAVTTDAYREHVERAGLEPEIKWLLGRAQTIQAQQDVSERIEALFVETGLEGDIGAEIRAAHRQLSNPRPPPVAVRSSATAEDTAEASFAGQQETYLWIDGEDPVVEHVARCWGSLFTPQAIAYRADRSIPLSDVAMGVVIQEMVPASAAGVMITIDPVTGDPSQIAIEACYGLGVGVVGGEVTPDRFFVDKVTLEMRDRQTSIKQGAFQFDRKTGEVRMMSLDSDLREVPCISEEEVFAIAELGKRVERDVGSAQDIEWALGPGEPGSRQLFLLQTRPETVWSRRSREPFATKGSTVMDRLLDTFRKPVRLDD